MRDIRFTFVCNQKEFDLIEALACMHLRSKSDVVRKAVIRFAAEENIRDRAAYLKKCEDEFAYEYLGGMESNDEN